MTSDTHGFCSQQQQYNLKEMSGIRGFLKQFAGGAVTIEKNPTYGVAIMTISNPEKRNAMSGHMLVELHDRICELERWKDGKAVIFRGSGGNFCAGGDLDFAEATGNEEAATAMNEWTVMTLEKLSDLPLISVCVIEGPTLGGGTEMALACDYIVAMANVKFGVVHGRMGITTAWGGGTRLVRRIGHQRALELMLTSKILSAEECVTYGIAEEVLTDGEDAVLSWLQSRLQHHHSVTRAMKTISRKAAILGLKDAYDEERRIFAPFWGGELNRKALTARAKHVNADGVGDGDNTSSKK